MVLFGTNLVSNHSTKAPKKHHAQCPIWTILMHTRLKYNANFGYKRSFTCRSTNKNMKCIFRFVFCKSLEIRRFTLSPTFYPPFCHTLYYFLPLLSLFFNFSLFFLSLSLSLSFSKSSPVIALNTNLWTFTSLLLNMAKITVLITISRTLKRIIH